MQSIKVRPYKRSETFVDKDFSGSSYYQYTVQAIDTAGNKSDFAPPVSVKVLVNKNQFNVRKLEAIYDKDNKVILLSWEKVNKPIMYYVIYKKVEGGNLENYFSTEQDKISFVDREIIYDGEYQYGIKTVFLDGQSDITLSNKVIVKKGE